MSDPNPDEPTWLSERTPHLESSPRGAHSTRTRGLLVVGGVAAVVVALVLAATWSGPGPASAPAAPIRPEAVSPFANLPNVTSLTVSPGLMYATSSPNCTEIWSVNTTGAVHLYATLPLSNSLCGIGESAVVLAAVPGVAAPVLFAAAQGYLYEITNGGTNVSFLAHFSMPAGADMGLAYDDTGAFHHDLIVTAEAGSVWLYNLTSGNSSLLASLKAHIEGPSVAGPSFGADSGDLFLPAQLANTIFVVTPSGTVTNFTAWTEAESVSFFSGFFCHFGNSSGLLYVANQTAGLVQSFPASDFSGYVGYGFVDSEFRHRGIGAFDPTGATSTFVGSGGQLEQLAFVTPVANQGCGGGG